MANSAISQIAKSSVVLDGKERAVTVSGKLAATDKPGNIVYETATNTWTKADSDTAACRLTKIGVIEFVWRTSATFGEVDIDTAYTTTEDLVIIIGSFFGAIKLAIFIDDPGAAKYFGYTLMVSDTAGQLKALAYTATGATSGTAIRDLVQGWATEDGIPNGDTVAVIYMFGG